jgi:hypothetical protein
MFSGRSGVPMLTPRFFSLWAAAIVSAWIAGSVV